MKHNNYIQDRLVITIMTVILMTVIVVMVSGCQKSMADNPDYSPETLHALLGSTAESWIMQSPTYAFDGSNLTFKSATIVNSSPKQYILTYTFISSHSGYGDRTSQMLLQVLTTHEISITLQNNTVVSAIIDDDWDEFNNAFVDELRIPQMNLSNQSIATMTLIFEPKACVETPWELLMKNTSVRWIKAPTDEEQITTLYAEHYAVDVLTVHKIKIADAVCLACDVCGTGYRFQIIVRDSDTAPFIADGWLPFEQNNSTSTVTEPGKLGFVNMTNPASTHCVQHNGTLSIKETPEGQVGYCVLPNGHICEEWRYFRGECS